MKSSSLSATITEIVMVANDGKQREVEWMMRPLTISEIVRLIEQERTSAAMVAGYLPQTAA